jgi:hypothetical protein
MKEGKQIRPEWVPSAYKDEKEEKKQMEEIEAMRRDKDAGNFAKLTIKKTYKKGFGR